MVVIGEVGTGIHAEEAHLRASAGDNPGIGAWNQFRPLNIVQIVYLVRLMRRGDRECADRNFVRSVMDTGFFEVIETNRPVHFDNTGAFLSRPQRVLGSLLEVHEVLPGRSAGSAGGRLAFTCDHFDIFAVDELLDGAFPHHHDTVAGKCTGGNLCAGSQINPGDEITRIPVHLSGDAGIQFDFLDSV